MHYVILRDDDTNALTPIECLERLYRPFLDRGLPVNLAVIPDVLVDATTPEGKPEGFLTANWNSDDRRAQAMANLSPSPRRSGGDCPSPVGAGEGGPAKAGSDEGCREQNLCGPGEVVRLKSWMLAVDDSASSHSMLDVPCSTCDVSQHKTIPIGSNSELASYLRDNPGYHIAQHGCHHDYFEFARNSPTEITARLDRGSRLLAEAGFPKIETFVAPHDKFSRTAYREVRKRFAVISCGWFERGRLPMTWWPRYAAKKIHHAPHWRVGDTTLLSHPGCLLSWHHPYDSMLDEIKREVRSQRLTVLVTHWWEYFRDGQPDEEFIHSLHEVADYFAIQPDVRVISFSDVAQGKVPLN